MPSLATSATAAVPGIPAVVAAKRSNVAVTPTVAASARKTCPKASPKSAPRRVIRRSSSHSHWLSGAPVQVTASSARASNGDSPIAM